MFTFRRRRICNVAHCNVHLIAEMAFILRLFFRLGLRWVFFVFLFCFCSLVYRSVRLLQLTETSYDLFAKQTINYRRFNHREMNLAVRMTDFATMLVITQ